MEAYRVKIAHYEKNMKNKTERIFVYLGDQQGFISILDLTHLIKSELKIKSCEEYKKTNSYQLRRKEAHDVSKMVSNLISMNLNNRKKPIIKILEYQTVLVKRWKAHSNAIILLKEMG